MDFYHLHIICHVDANATRLSPHIVDDRRVEPIGEGDVIGWFEGLLRQFSIDGMCFCGQARIGGRLYRLRGTLRGETAA